MRYSLTTLIFILILNIGCNSDSKIEHPSKKVKESVLSENSKKNSVQVDTTKNSLAVNRLNSKKYQISKEPIIKQPNSNPKSKIPLEKKENNIAITKNKSIPEKIVKKQAKQKKGKLYFNQTIHQFGVLIEGEEIDHIFKFTNIGKAAISIQNIKVSCGCTTPNYSFMDIGPGETGKISVNYSSKNKWGHQKPLLTVFTNGYPSEYKIYLEGDVHEKPKESKED